MKRRKFIQSTLAASAIPFVANAKGSEFPKNGKELIELREYELKFGGNRNGLINYLKNALIPALNKQGIENVGVFEEYGMSTPAKMYLLISYPSFKAYGKLLEQLKEDEGFQKLSAEYDAIPQQKASYSRFDSTLFLAFDAIPKLKKAAAGSGLFELRTYEGYNEDAVRRKIKMFNKEEIDLFLKTGLIPVFFGEALIGKDLPNLTYMLAFKDMEERDKNWDVFIKHPEWKRMSKLPEYANTVSNIVRTFLKPMDFSQF
ncbi:MAG: NIPSNAP family containing protein [Bacteroidetes bacterium]|nr:NIPSNAP family containing protein [Bacteroidota bacterium]